MAPSARCFQGAVATVSEQRSCQTTATDASKGRMKALLLCLTLFFLLSVCCVGCGIGQPPVKTLGQWQADDERVRSRGD